MASRTFLLLVFLASCCVNARPLRVMCWNILYKNFDCCGGNAAQRSGIANVVTDYFQADLVGMQECINENEMQAAFGDAMVSAPSTDTFNCIFYNPSALKFGGTSGRQYLGDDARDDYSERYLSYANFFQSGVEFWLFSTHWCLDGPCAGLAGGERHQISAARILQKRQELGAHMLPAIITADTNSHMDGYDNDDGVQWLLANGFEIAAKGPMAGGIDYIFVSKGDWNIGSSLVGPTEPSDHPSFFVELSLRSNTSVTFTSTETSTLTTTKVSLTTTETLTTTTTIEDLTSTTFTTITSHVQLSDASSTMQDGKVRWLVASILMGAILF